LEGVLWLEELLARSGLSQVIVTHDRGFLERVCSRVLEINRGYPEGFFACPGSYSQFLERRAEFFASQADQQASLGNSVRREVEWLRRGAKARSTKQQARIDRAGEMIEQLDDLKQRNNSNRTLSIEFGASGRETRRLVEFIQVGKALGGRQLFGPLDLLLSPGSRLGLLGPNGSGKTTLLRLLAGELEPDQGTIKRAERLEVVRFDQHREQLDMRQSLKEALAGAGEHVHLNGSAIHVAGWAKRFLFRPEQLDMPLSRLSGGEQSRVLIARLMLKSADLLLLDEPTNDLDLPSLEVLEQSLLDFPGALVLVTHDRWLLDRVCQRLLALDGQGAAESLASLEQWEAWRKSRDKPKAGKRSVPKLAASPDPKRLLNGRERNELRTIEASISAAEAKAKTARQALADPAIAADASALLERHRLLEEAEAQVAGLFKRWEALEAKRRLEE
jgi:ATP-binding cassette subfamily F protein uup